MNSPARIFAIGISRTGIAELCRVQAKSNDLIPIGDMQAKRTREVFTNEPLRRAVILAVKLDDPVADLKQIFMVLLMTAAEFAADCFEERRFIAEVVCHQGPQPADQEFEFARGTRAELIAALDDHLMICVDCIMPDHKMFDLIAALAPGPLSIGFLHSSIPVAPGVQAPP